MRSLARRRRGGGANDVGGTRRQTRLLASTARRSSDARRRHRSSREGGSKVHRCPFAVSPTTKAEPCRRSRAPDTRPRPLPRERPSCGHGRPRIGAATSQNGEDDAAGVIEAKAKPPSSTSVPLPFDPQGEDRSGRRLLPATTTPADRIVGGGGSDDETCAHSNCARTGVCVEQWRAVSEKQKTSGVDHGRTLLSAKRRRGGSLCNTPDTARTGNIQARGSDGRKRRPITKDSQGVQICGSIALMKRLRTSSGAAF